MVTLVALAPKNTASIMVMARGYSYRGIYLADGKNYSSGLLLCTATNVHCLIHLTMKL